MIPPTAYLEWARRLHGSVKYDLATSGIPHVGDSEIGPVAGLSDAGSYARLKAEIVRATGASPDEVVPTLGTSQALWCAYAASLSVGDEALVERPAYEPMLVTAGSTGARVSSFARDRRRAFALDPEAVLEALGPTTRVVAISSLHNPSGARTPRETLRHLAAKLATRDISLIVDEVYAPFDDLAPEGELPPSARELGPNVIAVASLTKCFGVGLHRVGWLLAAPEIARRAEDAITATTGILPTSHAAIGARCMEILPALSGRARHHLGTKRERVSAWARARGLEWSEPEAGLFGFARVGDAPLRDALETGARTYGVLAAPGEFWGEPGGLRISWSLDESLLDEALSRLERVIMSVR